MSVFVASHRLHSIVVDAPAFTVTQDSALDSCFHSGGGDHTLCWRRLEQSGMAPRVSCSRLASNPTLKRPGHLGVAALLVSRCNLPGTAFERNLNSCTLFLEFAKNLFQSRGTVLSSKRHLSSPMLWFAPRMTIMYW